VCPRNRGIDDQVFEIWIFTQLSEKPLQPSFLPIAGDDKISAVRIAQSPEAKFF
jgi:hypothetical protein